MSQENFKLFSEMYRNIMENDEARLHDMIDQQKEYDKSFRSADLDNVCFYLRHIAVYLRIIAERQNDSGDKK